MWSDENTERNVVLRVAESKLKYLLEAVRAAVTACEEIWRDNLDKQYRLLCERAVTGVLSEFEVSFKQILWWGGGVAIPVTYRGRKAFLYLYYSEREVPGWRLHVENTKEFERTLSEYLRYGLDATPAFTIE